MITEKQAKYLRNFRRSAAALEVASSAGADIDSIAEHKRQLDKAEKGIRGEFQALVDQIRENLRLQERIEAQAEEIRMLKAELRESKKS